MKLKHLTFAIAVLMGGTLVAVMGEDAVELKLGPAVRAVTFAPLAAEGRMASFQNGFLPEIPLHETLVRFYDSDGKLVRTNETKLLGAERTAVQDVSVSRSGLLAVAAEAVDSAGKVATAILLFDQPGQAKWIVRINPFDAAKIA